HLGVIAGVADDGEVAWCETGGETAQQLGGARAARERRHPHGRRPPQLRVRDPIVWGAMSGPAGSHAKQRTATGPSGRSERVGEAGGWRAGGVGGGPGGGARVTGGGGGSGGAGRPGGGVGGPCGAPAGSHAKQRIATAPPGRSERVGGMGDHVGPPLRVTRNRGAPRLRRGDPNVWGVGGAVSGPPPLLPRLAGGPQPGAGAPPAESG